MNILLVNDDGYRSEALIYLKSVLEKYGRVYVIAPKEHMSGKSIALTIFEPIKMVEVSKDFYYIEGMPADCVSIGLTSLNVKFDLVVSGINYGHNLTYDIMHSGTCGACVEALMYKTPAISLSMERNHDDMFPYVDMALSYIFNNNLLSDRYFLNVNFPLGKEVKGIKLSKVGKRNDRRWYDLENGVLVPKRTIIEEGYGPDSDCYLINHGYISITPLTDNLFDEKIFDEINKQ